MIDSNDPQAWMDRLAIQDLVCVAQLRLGLKEYDDYLGFFTEDATMFYPLDQWKQNKGVQPNEGREIPIKEFFESLMEFLPGFEIIHNQMANFDITITGNTATSVCTVRSAHQIEDRHWAVGGFYRHNCVKTPAGWRIKRLSVQVGYELGEPLVSTALARTKTMPPWR